VQAKTVVKEATVTELALILNGNQTLSQTHRIIGATTRPVNTTTGEES
jgi:hypothetical protein